MSALSRNNAKQRQVVLDTETTGLDLTDGHRIIEIACLELDGRKLTDRRFHSYVNPERPIDSSARAIHGITDERVAHEPLFAAIAGELQEFIRDAEVLIHNAEFDVGFLDAEFTLLGLPRTEQICKVTDTLRLAKDLRPGKRNSLDVLCREFGIDNSNRQLHGALLDAELLAAVYLAMSRGQNSLMIDQAATATTATVHSAMTSITQSLARDSAPLKVLRASAEELAEHQQVLEQINKESKGKCLWLAE